jgi:hypothetical protein
MFSTSSFPSFRLNLNLNRLTFDLKLLLKLFQVDSEEEEDDEDYHKKNKKKRFKSDFIIDEAEVTFFNNSDYFLGCLRSFLDFVIINR